MIVGASQMRERNLQCDVAIFWALLHLQYTSIRPLSVWKLENAALKRLSRLPDLIAWSLFLFIFLHRVLPPFQLWRDPWDPGSWRDALIRARPPSTCTKLMNSAREMWMGTNVARGRGPSLRPDAGPPGLRALSSPRWKLGGFGVLSTPDGLNFLSQQRRLCLPRLDCAADQEGGHRERARGRVIFFSCFCFFGR